jgi:predicted GNAT family acetyltransferase
MTWAFTSWPGKLPEAAESWLLRDSVRNTVPLTALRGARSGQYTDDLLMGWFAEGEEVTGVVCHTPPHPLVIAATPSAVLDLARELIDRARSVPGVHGLRDTAEAFAAAWWEPAKERSLECLYRLGSLVTPPLPGRPRMAVAEDLPRAVEWIKAFQVEARIQVFADPTPVVSARINRNELLWWEAEGRPVSLAGVSAPISGMSRVGPVYTPVEWRRRGYGSAVTHAAARTALDRGAAEVVLFADQANPVPGSIYQALGFRAVADYARIRFR